jgi:hypothetical protein
MGKIDMGKEFIHAHEDIDKILHWADSIGLLLLPERLEDNDCQPKRPEEFRSFPRVTILLFRREWIVDAIELHRISGGINVGKYFVRTNINFAAISLSFDGDEDVAGVRRLGGGDISYGREWLHAKTHEMRLSPPDVAQTYKQVCKHLFSKISVRGGVHNYHVCKEAAELATRIPTRPPFDYIPWPPPGLDKLSKR